MVQGQTSPSMRDGNKDSALIRGVGRGRGPDAVIVVPCGVLGEHDTTQEAAMCVLVVEVAELTGVLFERQRPTACNDS
jgi:hypothetical protein